jgi:hypothetical protein
MKRHFRFVLGMSAATTLAVVSAGVASADTAVQPGFRLHTPVYTCPPPYDPTTCVKSTDGSFNKWVTYTNRGGDSPLDTNTNNSALSVNTMQGPDDHAEIWSKASDNINKRADEMANLSFDIRTKTLQGGSPRINVFLQQNSSDGSAYVSISDLCAVPIGTTAWSRVDATSDGTGCTITTSGGTAYKSSPTFSAWDAFTAANPDAVVTNDYMVFDQPGYYRLDRISLGTGVMYTSSNTTAFTCTTEASC